MRLKCATPSSRLIGLPAWFETSLTTGKALALCFLAGFLIRLIPEVLAFPYPIGWDAVHYAVAMKNGVILSHWSQFFATTWLFNAVTIPLYNLSKLDPFLILKFVAPALYGFNVAGVYWFARKALGWSVKLSLFAGGLFSIQLASIRISWDLFRNLLGMGLLLFTLPLAYKPLSKRGFLWLVLLSLLAVFAHEYSAVTLLAIVSGLLCWRLLRKKLTRANVQAFLAVLPAAFVFLAGVFLRVFPAKLGEATNVIDFSDSSSRFLFFTDYLSVKDAVYYYPTYWWLVADVLALSAFLYLSYFYLVWKGYFKHGILSFWVALLLVGAFGCLVFPFFALDLWDRWMFMLVYPFAFYAANGLWRLLKTYNNPRAHQRFGALAAKVKVMLIITGLLGSIYLATPTLMNTVNAGVFSVYPVSAHFSSAPTVPYQDVDSVKQAMNWLNANMDNQSCVVLHHAFFPWGLLYLDKTHELVHFINDADAAVEVCLQHGFSHVFFIWWNQNLGWYDISVPEYLTRTEDFGRLSVYSYGM